MPITKYEIRQALTAFWGTVLIELNARAFCVPRWTRVFSTFSCKPLQSKGLPSKVSEENLLPMMSK